MRGPVSNYPDFLFIELNRVGYAGVDAWVCACWCAWELTCVGVDVLVCVGVMIGMIT